MVQTRLLGVIGGMGPAATVGFIEKVVAYSPAERDQDHIPMVIEMCTKIPDRTMALRRADGEVPRMIREAGERLARRGAEVLVMPCNTAHVWASVLDGLSAEFINMVELAKRRIVAEGLSTVGVLATRGTVTSRLYWDIEDGGARKALEGLQECTDTIIRMVKGGRVGEARQELHEVLSRSAGLGIGCVVLGCSELSLLWSHGQNEVVVCDPVALLAEEVVVRAYGRRRTVVE